MSGAFDGSGMSFLATYITTIAQGITLNVFWAGFALVVLCLQFLLGSIWRALTS